MTDDTTELSTPNFVRAILTEFEAGGDFDENAVGERLKEAIVGSHSLAPPDESAAKAECWAFLFHPSLPDERSAWDTFFGPRIQHADGRCEPDLSRIDARTIKYWQRRMFESQHPVARARYADLVWDLSKTVSKIKPPIEAARNAIDSYIECQAICSLQTADQAELRLLRGLTLALSIQDAHRVSLVRDALFCFQARYPRWFGWVTLFDTLLENPRITCTSDQIDQVIRGMEDQLSHTCGNTAGAGSVELKDMALRLAMYYRRLQRADDVSRVVSLWGGAVERLSALAHGIVALGWLTDLHSVYRDFGLRADAKRVLIAVKAKGAETEQQMPTITASVSLDPAEFEQFLDHITAGSLHDVFSKIVATFLPNIEEIRREIDELRWRHPLLAMFPKAKIADNQIVARTLSAETDPDGHLLSEIASRIGLSAPFLTSTINRMRERHNVATDDLARFMQDSDLFDVNDMDLLREGMDAYLANDHVKAIHVLVPRIEHALRRLLGGLGEPTNKSRRGQITMLEKSLSDMLESEPALRSYLGEGVVLYLRALLVDPSAYNIRNRLSHGLLPHSSFTRLLSDRVLHALLIFGRLRITGMAANDA